MVSLLRRTCLVAVSVLALFLAGCSQTTMNSFSTDRSQLMLISAEEVAQASSQAYDEILAEARQKGILNSNPRLTRRVRSIANRLIAEAPRFREDCRDWEWEVNVIDSEEVNAWCMAGGKIAVYSAIVTELDLSDDELATVIGHEMAHALREHVREQQSAEIVKQSAISLAATLFGVESDTILSLGQYAATVAFSLPFSRRHETEADELGLELMYVAGFDPDAAVTLWTKMSQMSSGNEGIAALLSTHPADSERIDNLRDLSYRLQHRD